MKYFLPLLTILFIYLKQTDQIDWDWLWVMSPLWIGFIIGIIMLIIALVINSKLHK